MLTNGGELEGGVISDYGSEGESCLFISNLLSGSLDNFNVVGEGGGAHRNEVGVAGVENKNTGNVCLVSEVSCVVCVDSILVSAGVYAVCKVDLKSSGEITSVCSNVALFIIEREIEILGCILGHILGTNLNTLNGYCKTYVVFKVSTCCELFGYIKSGNFLDSAINNSKCSALSFLHAGIRLNNCGNGYGHTNLNACLNRVCLKTVAVVTALALYVSEEEVVVLVVYALTVHSNYDTLDNNGGTLFSCHVVLERYENILRNYAIVRNGCSCSVGSSDSSCHSICMLCFCLFIYIDSPIGRTLDSLNKLIVNSPGNSVLNTCNHYLTKNLEVSCCNVVFLLIQAIEVFNCCIKIVLHYGRLSCFFLRLGSSSLFFGCLLGNFCGSFFGCVLLTRCEERNAHNYCQAECNKFFHNFSFYECFLYYYLIIISVGTKTFI